MKNFQVCNRVAYITLFATVFLALIAFIPGGRVPADILKGYVLVFGVLIAFSAWLIGRVLEGKITFPWSLTLGGAGIFLIALFLSALFSHAPYLSFFGEGFDKGAFIIIAMFFLVLFLSSILFVRERRRVYFFLGFLGLYILVALFQLVHIFFTNGTTLGYFVGKVGTLFGDWNDFAILSGASLVLLVSILEFFKTPKFIKITAMFASALALFFVILTNAFIVWILVGISAIAILIYKLLSTRLLSERKFPYFAFTTVLVTLLFIFANNLLGGFLASKLSTQFVSPVPNWSSTLSVAKESIAHNPIFGFGPNRFLHEWQAYHPVAVNKDAKWWNAPFTSGVSYFVTIAMLAGFLGVLALLVFLAGLLYESVEKVFSRDTSFDLRSFGGSLLFCTFLISVYFVAVLFFFPPGTSVVVLAFMLVGILLANLSGMGRIPSRTLLFIHGKWKSLLSVVGIVALLLLSAGTLYAGTERFASSIYYGISVYDANNGDIAKADSRIVQAITLFDLPLYERTRVAFSIQYLQKIVSDSGATASGDSASGALKDLFKNSFSIGSDSAMRAITLDPSDENNYVTLGDFMAMVVPLKVADSFTSAQNAYNNALAIAPHDPSIYLKLAELSYSNGDAQGARDYAGRALAEKSNYADAFYFLAQVEQASGNASLAVQRLEDAVNSAPDDADLNFELGLMRYKSGDYEGAVSSLQTVTRIAPDYLNAWYFLALSEDGVGSHDLALTILTALNKKLPNNSDIENALQNVQTGKPIITTQNVTLPDAKEKPKTLPVVSPSKSKK